MNIGHRLFARGFQALALILLLVLSNWSALAAPRNSAVQTAEQNSPLFTQAQRNASRDGYTLLTTPELKRLLEQNPDVLLVDVRFSYEYASSHMPDAVSMPVDLRDRNDLPRERRQAMLDTFGADKDRPIVVYCRDFR